MYVITLTIKFTIVAVRTLYLQVGVGSFTQLLCFVEMYDWSVDLEL